MSSPHQSVLLDSVIEVLDPQPGERYLDLTAGYGGHAASIIRRTGPAIAVLVDTDETAIEALRDRFGGSVELKLSNYVSAARELIDEGRQFDLILLDLGVSSPQIDNPDRGFSFKASGPLDMRMDRRQRLTAYDVVNRYGETELADIIARYGEERRARAVTRRIVRSRPVETTGQLAKIVHEVVTPSGRIDPATRTFQAIRLEVNHEIESLQQVLPLVLKLLSPQGRMAIISFHSLEDRIVKRFIQVESRDCICPPSQPVCTCSHRASLEPIGRVIKGGDNDSNNPRARSAKLRAARKLKPKQKGGSS
jgi:16S rRNA (cytosine1402-N4)-methyltransferase